MLRFKCPKCGKIADVIERNYGFIEDFPIKGLVDGKIEYGDDGDEFTDQRDYLCRECEEPIDGIDNDKDLIKYLQEHGVESPKDDKEDD